MITIYVGDVGSGKSLSIIKDIVTRKQKVFTNFELNNIEYTRLKFDMLLNKIYGDKNKMSYSVNFDFWKEQAKTGGFDIYLDEFHNLMNSRQSMSRRNIALSDWLSQIRKILGSNEINNLYLVTQKIKRIDINSQDLAQCCILCIKHLHKNILIPTEVYDKAKNKISIKNLPLSIIYKHWFNNSDALRMFEALGMGKPYKVTRFVANDYYKYYNSYEILQVEDEEYV